MGIGPYFVQQNKNQISPLLYILLYSQLAMIIALSAGLVQLERICSYTILFSSIGLYIYSYLQNRYISVQDLLFIAFLGYLFMLAAAYSWKYDEIKSVTVFLSMLTVWRGSRALPCSKKTEKVILNFFTIQALILIVLYFTPLAYKSYQAYVAVSSELTLGFSNPNQTGIILFSTATILLILSRKCSLSKQQKRILLVVIAILSVLLILTDARTSILCYVFFLIFFFKKKKIKVSSNISSSIICFPIGFVFLYDALSKTKLQTLSFAGKKLFSGRQRVFTQVLDAFTNKLLGNLAYFRFQNSHNALLTVLVNTGIIGLGFYLVFTILSFNSVKRTGNSDNKYVIVIAILALFVMGCAETAVLTGGTIYYVHMLIMLILANNTSEDLEMEEL